MADHLSSRLAQMNPFKSGSDEDEDVGGVIGADTVGGGGRHNRKADHAKDELRVSHALRSFLVKEKVLSERDAGLDADEPSDALRRLLSRTSFSAPAALLDRSHPLPEYFISSSHNTYLVAHQLYGTSSAAAYQTALRTGSRCVEIDAWDNSENEDEPKVTHGYTLVSHVPFRAVCETIREVFDEELAFAASNPGYVAAPIMVSLENHCGDHGQLRLVQIMKEVFGPRLLSEAVRHAGHREQDGGGGHVRLADLGPRITVIVEYHVPGETDDSDFSSSNESDAEEEEREARKAYDENKREKAAASSVIVPELAELGVYAQSVKPSDNSWYDPGSSSTGRITTSSTCPSRGCPSISRPAPCPSAGTTPTT